MFDQDFCTYLEYQLCEFFKSSDQEALKGFWCDGVLPVKHSKQYITHNKTALLKALSARMDKLSLKSY